MRLSSSRSTAIIHRPQQDFPLWDLAGSKPSLDQQFADRGDLIDAVSGQQLITFTRASAGTYVGSDGLIKTAVTNEARFDHDPVTGESLGLLVEESRTNLVTYSEQFDDAAWSTSSLTLTPNDASAPDGNQTADKWQNTSTTGIIYQLLTKAASAITYIASVWVKSSDSTNFSLTIDDGATVNRGRCTFNITTGELVTENNEGNFTNTSGSITAYPDSWYRITVTTTTNTTTTVRFRAFFSGNGDNAYLWGAQLEAGSLPTSYIPTEGSTVTRAADVATDTSTGADIRTLYAQFRSPASGTRPIASLDDNTANERIELLTSGTDPKMLVADGGSAVADIDAGSVTAGTLTKLSARFATDDYAAAVDGGTPQTDTAGTLPTVDRLRIGSDQAGNYFNGTIARLTAWDAALPDSSIERVTQ